MHRGIQHTIQPEDAALVIVFIFVAAAAWNLNSGFNPSLFAAAAQAFSFGHDCHPYSVVLAAPGPLAFLACLRLLQPRVEMNLHVVAHRIGDRAGLPGFSGRLIETGWV